MTQLISNPFLVPLIERTTTTTTQQEMFSCTHCGFVTRYEVELNVHMRIHYHLIFFKYSKV